MSVSPIPKGYHSVTPYLMVRGADKEIEFLKKAFGAMEKERHTTPDGSIMHAEVHIGDSTVMLGEAKGECEPINAMLYLYVPDVDVIYQRALNAGAKSAQEVTDQFYGDRSGAVTSPGGNRWWIATHKEDVSADELQRRMQQFNAQHQSEQQKKAA